MRKGLYVQYGCGLKAPLEWRNFDASPTLRVERLPVFGRLYKRVGVRFPANVEYGDIVKGLPLPAESCAGVYASHVLEHLSLDDFRLALKNTFRLLCPHGTFRLVVPDLKSLCQTYLESSDATAAEDFMRATSLGVASRHRGVSGLLRVWLGNSMHLWMWDFESLRHELENAGFGNIRQCRFGDSSDPMFGLVEDEDRFVEAVAVECFKTGQVE